MSRTMRSLLGICAIPLVLGPGRALANPNDCYHCQRVHCPPGLKHCMERPPHIHWQCGCPRPICNPCVNPNWGYFEPCWNPWPWPPDYSHCRVAPPASMVVLDPGTHGMALPQALAPGAMPPGAVPQGNLPPVTLSPGAVPPGVVIPQGPGVSPQYAPPQYVPPQYAPPVQNVPPPANSNVLPPPRPYRPGL